MRHEPEPESAGETSCGEVELRDGSWWWWRWWDAASAVVGVVTAATAIVPVAPAPAPAPAPVAPGAAASGCATAWMFLPWTGRHLTFRSNRADPLLVAAAPCNTHPLSLPPDLALIVLWWWWWCGGGGGGQLELIKELERERVLDAELAAARQLRRITTMRIHSRMKRGEQLRQHHEARNSRMRHRTFTAETRGRDITRCVLWHAVRPAALQKGLRRQSLLLTPGAAWSADVVSFVGIHDSADGWLLGHSSLVIFCTRRASRCTQRCVWVVSN